MSTNRAATDLAASPRLRRLLERALPGAELVDVVPLKPDAEIHDESSKGAGYGAPLRLDVSHGGKRKSLVLHTETSNPFGHDRRADRASSVLLAADTFGTLADHVAVLDVGAYRGSDDFVSLTGTGEFYLLTAHAEGRVYAEDLRRIAASGRVTGKDEQRARLLVQKLLLLHSAVPGDGSTRYARCLRDTLGSGEGIFGIVDGYPDDVPRASPQRLLRIQERCLAERFRLRSEAARLRRTHGDFHPFNVVFDENDRLALLDASRGAVGEPADDVTCMAINFAFFSLGHPGSWRDALGGLWRDFWGGYVRGSGDERIAEVAPLFLAWRGLVLANPVWYPELASSDRDRILSFVEHALDARPFRPELANEFFDS